MRWSLVVAVVAMGTGCLGEGDLTLAEVQCGAEPLRFVFSPSFLMVAPGGDLNATILLHNPGTVNHTVPTSFQVLTYQLVGEKVGELPGGHGQSIEYGEVPVVEPGGTRAFSATSASARTVEGEWAEGEYVARYAAHNACGLLAVSVRET